jgi:hypothetical protein
MYVVYMYVCMYISNNTLAIFSFWSNDSPVCERGQAGRQSVRLDPPSSLSAALHENVVDWSDGSPVCDRGRQADINVDDDNLTPYDRFTKF